MTPALDPPIGLPGVEVREGVVHVGRCLQMVAHKKLSPAALVVAAAGGNTEEHGRHLAGHHRMGCCVIYRTLASRCRDKKKRRNVKRRKKKNEEDDRGYNTGHDSEKHQQHNDSKASKRETESGIDTWESHSRCSGRAYPPPLSLSFPPPASAWCHFRDRAQDAWSTV